MEEKQYSYVDKKNGLVVVKMNYHELVSQMETYQPSGNPDKEVVNYIETYRKDKHDKGFSGGSYKDFINLPDMEPFLKAKQKILDSKLDQKINNAVGYKPKRKRTNDEYDGDWNYDRRWDVKPYNRAFKMPVPNRFVSIDADFSINAGTSAEAIHNYGAIVWAIAQILEELGINIEIKITNKCQRQFGETTHNCIYGGNSEFIVKRSDEYMSPQALASVFRSVFYRIGIFGTWRIEGEKLGLFTDSSLGYPDGRKFNAIKFENNTLFIAPDVRPDENKIQEEITKIINGGLND